MISGSCTARGGARMHKVSFLSRLQTYHLEVR